MAKIPTTVKPKVILVQGAPYSGKDSFYRSLTSSFKAGEIVRLAFGDIIKDRAHKALGLDVKTNFFENSKDVMNETYFNGFTPREAYIDFSENLLKKYRGPSIVGLELTEKIKVLQRSIHPPKLVVITDSGFIEEAEPVVEHMGFDHTVIVSVQRKDAPDVADSRHRFDIEGVPTYFLENDSSLQDYEIKVKQIVNEVLA